MSIVINGTTNTITAGSGVTLAGALTLGGTVSGGGNQINNVVIGASTPLAGSFTTLSTTGAVTLPNNLAAGITTANGYINIKPGAGASNHLYLDAPTSASVFIRPNGSVTTAEFTSTEILNSKGYYSSIAGVHAYLNAPTGQLSSLAVNHVAIASASSTGLAVTGTLSATGAITGASLGLGTGAISCGYITAVNTSYGTVGLTSASSFAEVNIRPSVSNSGGISWTENSIADRWTLGIKPSDASLYLYTGRGFAGTNVATFTSTGLAVTGTLSATTGAAVGGATPGTGGIAFPATAVAVANANTLDDYEEGTWTPTYTRDGVAPTGIVYGNGQVGTYTKIGRVVTANFTLGATAVSTQGSGNWQIAGFPFAVNSTTNYRASGHCAVSGQLSNIPTGFYHVAGGVTAYISAAGVVDSSSTLTTSAIFAGSITYEV